MRGSTYRWGEATAFPKQWVSHSRATRPLYPFSVNWISPPALITSIPQHCCELQTWSLAGAIRPQSQSLLGLKSETESPFFWWKELGYMGSFLQQWKLWSGHKHCPRVSVWTGHGQRIQLPAASSLASAGRIHTQAHLSHHVRTFFFFLKWSI